MKPKFVRSKETIFSEVGEDIVALNIPVGFAYGMEKVTADVWRLLDQPQDLDGLCEQLLAQYDVDPAVCRDEVSKLLDQFLTEGLIEPAARDGPPR